MVLTATALGSVVWLWVVHQSGRREAWDSELYFSRGLPIVALSAAVFGYLDPDRPWRWGMAPFAGQAIVAFARHPGGNLLPLGLVTFAIFGALCSVPAYLAARIRRVIARR